jgi:hypothetical protein
MTLSALAGARGGRREFVAKESENELGFPRAWWNFSFLYLAHWLKTVGLDPTAQGEGGADVTPAWAKWAA